MTRARRSIGAWVRGVLDKTQVGPSTSAIGRHIGSRC
jgi:hypothetical protein